MRKPVNDFFRNDDDQALTQRLELLMQDSNRYTEYLRSNGLLFESEQERIIREFWERQSLGPGEWKQNLGPGEWTVCD